MKHACLSCLGCKENQANQQGHDFGCGENSGWIYCSRFYFDHAASCIDQEQHRIFKKMLDLVTYENKYSDIPMIDMLEFFADYRGDPFKRIGCNHSFLRDKLEAEHEKQNPMPTGDNISVLD